MIVREVNVPWWNDKCTEATKMRNRAFKNLRRTLAMDNLINYQKTTMNDVWMMIKKMIGKFKPPHVPVLIKDGTH